MSDKAYLKRLFQAYYKKKKFVIPNINLFDQREFGFIPWDKQIMIRHMAFRSPENLLKYLSENGPRHVYSSGSIYLQPDNLDMNKKEYKECDLIVDIDVDHFYTPCKDDHDLWWCEECGKSGKGMPEECPKCGKSKFKTTNWICSDCLEIAKNEIKKLINNFLIPDFGIDEKDLKIAFSGHRGYHLKVENKKIMSLLSEERREIVDYITGDNLSFEILGLTEKRGTIYGLSKANLGWSQKIVTKIEELLRKSNVEIEHFLLDKRKVGFNPHIVKAFIKSKDDFLEVLSNSNKNIWSIEGFGLQKWKKFLKGIVNEIGVNIDEPVTIDIHRLIRYPGSLHGKSGFKVQELTLEELDDFNFLNEQNMTLDPIVFEGQNFQKLEIIEQNLPATKIKGESFGPYKKGEKIDVPHHIAVFLLCKEVAKIID